MFHIQHNFNINVLEGNILLTSWGMDRRKQHCEASNFLALLAKFTMKFSIWCCVKGLVICSAPCCCIVSLCPHGCTRLHKSGYLWMGSWACISQCCEAKLTDYILLSSWFLPLFLPAVACYWALNQLFTLFLQLNEWFRRHLLHDIIFSLAIFLLLSVSCALWRVFRVKHPNILQLVDVFETKKEYFLFLELWVQMSDEPGEKALCLSLQSLWPAELYVLIIHSWGMSCCSLRPGRYESSSEIHSFGIQMWLLASCSILTCACVLGEFDTFPWICLMMEMIQMFL